MFRPRVIPCLLLKHLGLVKTIKFKNPTYLGDPINAVKIFNDLEADELVFLDITATKENRLIDLNLIKKIGDEAFMPFAVGGGIKSLEDAEKIITAGAEKIVLNTEAYNNPKLVEQIARSFGSQSVIISIDAKKDIWGEYKVFIKDGNKKTKISPIEHAKTMENAGAGEILINSINHDGMMNGYNLNLIKNISEAVNIPVIASGGAWEHQHLKDAIQISNASAVSAGSMFVFHGPRRAVLINYPTKKELKQLFE